LAQATILVGLSRRTSPDLSLGMIEMALRSGGALCCFGTCVVALVMVAEGTADATKHTFSPGTAWPGC
jgi:hypothetical protein